MIVPNDVLAPRSRLSLNNVTFSGRPTLSFLFLFGILPLWDAEVTERGGSDETGLLRVFYLVKIYKSL